MALRNFISFIADVSFDVLQFPQVNVLPYICTSSFGRLGSAGGIKVSGSEKHISKPS